MDQEKRNEPFAVRTHWLDGDTTLAAQLGSALSASTRGLVILAITLDDGRPACAALSPGAALALAQRLDQFAAIAAFEETAAADCRPRPPVQ